MRRSWFGLRPCVLPCTLLMGVAPFVCVSARPLKKQKAPALGLPPVLLSRPQVRRRVKRAEKTDAAVEPFDVSLCADTSSGVSARRPPRLRKQRDKKTGRACEAAASFSSNRADYSTMSGIARENLPIAERRISELGLNRAAPAFGHSYAMRVSS